MAEWLPHLNATLNGGSALCLIGGWWAIRRRAITQHRLLMMTALFFSIVFLISYLIRFYLTGTHRYQSDGWDRIVYLVILGTHTPLAAFVPFLAARSIYLAIKERFEAHRKWARITLPIWLYVSLTGVTIYYMLYHYSGSAS